MKRDVWCILGLPFDSIDMGGAVNKLYDSIKNKSPCFISTPNLNFLIESQKDVAFRNSVINSDLSVADGKPLVWISKLLRIPISERVAGSDLIEALIENKRGYEPLNVFFFGGEKGVSEVACKTLNGNVSGLRCVGNHNPGFGSIEEMSSEIIIEQINQSNADFIIVSLGAKKGQAWIEKNRIKINAPAISHLGAVVNFIAGTVNRSPKLMQKLGLEWLWRIKEEPSLWRRYFFDGISFIKLIVSRVIPLFILISFFEKRRKKYESILKISDYDNEIKIELSGYWGGRNIAEINKCFENILYSYSSKVVKVSLDENAYLDAATLAKFLLLKNKLWDNNRELIVKSKSKLVSKIFYYNCCEYMLSE